MALLENWSKRHVTYYKKLPSRKFKDVIAFLSTRVYSRDALSRKGTSHVLNEQATRLLTSSQVHQDHIEKRKGGERASVAMERMKIWKSFQEGQRPTKRQLSFTDGLVGDSQVSKIAPNRGANFEIIIKCFQK